jgi:N-acetylmuramic acid 6-phosphate etherase
MINTTEATSNHQNLETKSTRELLLGINQEDVSVPKAVEKAIPQLEALIEAILPRMQAGGRLFYIGAGTSGRLGILDASECSPTYGVPEGLIVGLIAGGDGAIRKAVENAEDDAQQAWQDLLFFKPTPQDSLIGIAASGRTPYVIGGIEMAAQYGLLTGSIVCNQGSKVAAISAFPVEIVVGPEYVTGSTRMKSGTAQKLALNMISTSLMIRLGHVIGNKMVDMQLSNEKLVNRAILMVMDQTNCSAQQAKELIEKYGSVRLAIDAFFKQ